MVALLSQAQVIDRRPETDTLSLADRITLRTNAVDWLLLLPNIGVEFDLGNKNWSRWSIGLDVRGNWQTKHTFKPGVVYMERFWNPETLQTKTHGWTEMNVNMLTRADAPFNDVVGTYTLRGFLVKVYPAEGAPEGIWTRPEDFSSWLARPADPTEEVTV